MIEDYDFLVFLSEDWHTFFRRHLIRALAGRLRRSKVLCVDRPVDLLITPWRKPTKFGKWATRQGNLWQESENLSILRPFLALHDHLAARLPIATRVDSKLMRWQLDKTMDRLGLRRNHVILWIFDPIQEPCLSLLRTKLAIYECCDEYTAYPTLPIVRTADDVTSRERRVLGMVDLALAVSEPLYREKSKYCKRMHVLPNAADTASLRRAASEQTLIAHDIATIRHPIVGFLGNLTGRVDFTLLNLLARNHPEWSIVVVGGVTDPPREDGSRRSLATLRELNNVVFLGSRSYDALPGYLKAFDVCLIPYNQNDPFNINCSPLKLYEYLATGKPIVSTDLPAVRAMDGLVRIACDHREFELAVAVALEENDEPLRQQRLMAAQENSWDKRACQMIELVEQCL